MESILSSRVRMSNGSRAGCPGKLQPENAHFYAAV
jgi:hypothetical protein